MTIISGLLPIFMFSDTYEYYYVTKYYYSSSTFDFIKLSNAHDV